MIYYTPKQKNKVFLRTDSKGTQPKYKENNKWYKENMLGNEGLAEELSSLILEHSVMPSDVSFVKYKQCMIGDKKGCVSDNFLLPGENFISIQTMYYNTHNKEITEDLFSISDIKQRFEYVVDYVKKITDLDISNYLKTIINLDAIIVNPDRHYGNIGVIQKADNTFKLAPIFDNGQGLSMNFQITNPLMEYDEKIDILTSATICGSFEKTLLIVGPILEINYESLFENLEKYPDSIAKSFLINQLNRYEKIFSLQKIQE